MKNSKLVGIGRVLGSHGNKGELKLALYTGDCGELFFSRVVFNKKGILKELEIESQRSLKNTCIVKFKGISSISQAQEYSGLECFLPESELKPPGEDEVYLHQIVGCSVVTMEGRQIGTAVDVLFYPGNEILVIEREGREILIPFNRTICREIDLKSRRISVDPPEGLLDLNEV